jgi:hypothetical protein
MQEHALEAHHGRTVTIDLCEPCQSFWFDERESLQLSPAATLVLFRIIGERVARPAWRDADIVKCPRCSGRLRRTRDLQRSTRFEYFKCPNQHGRLISFFEFLKEKDFIKPLSPQQLAALRQHVQTVHCSNCGAAIDLAQASACTHCGSPLSLLDITQAEKVVQRLRDADPGGRNLDPLLPRHLDRARRQAEAAFSGEPGSGAWFDDVSSTGLVGAGLHLVIESLRRSSD